MRRLPECSVSCIQLHSSVKEQQTMLEQLPQSLVPIIPQGRTTRHPGSLNQIRLSCYALLPLGISFYCVVTLPSLKASWHSIFKKGQCSCEFRSGQSLAHGFMQPTMHFFNRTHRALMESGRSSPSCGQAILYRAYPPHLALRLRQSVVVATKSN